MFVVAKWEGEINQLEIKSVDTLETKLVIPVDSHINDIIELRCTSGIYGVYTDGSLAIGFADGHISIIQVASNL
jgi:hypothetical protein